MKHGTDYRVVDVDDRSLLFLAGNHRTFAITPDLGQRLRRGLDELTGDERREWDRLIELGLVSDENPGVLRSGTFADGADLAINVNLTNICNLACTYCFAEGGDYGRIKEAMDHDSVDHIFSFIRSNVTPSRSVRLEMFGGEPLANFQTLREVCARSEGFAAETGISFKYRISTNLTLLPEGILDLFARHNFIVSVSIDGGREVQDANRPAKGGQGSYDRVMRNVRKVRAASDDIIMVARMTVAQDKPALLENVLELWKLNIFDYFQIYPGVYPEDEQDETPAVTQGKVFLDLPAIPGKESTRSSCSPAPSSSKYINYFLRPGMTEQFKAFLEAYPSLFTPDNRFNGVLEYERTAQLILEGYLALAFCSGGRTYFTHSPDKSISPCHRLVGDASFDVGRAEAGLTTTPTEWRHTVDSHPVCGQCWARYLCGGGCKQENFVATGDLNTLNTESCAYQLLLAEEVIRMMGRSSDDYLRRDRSQFNDMFVSCGRPVMPNGRSDATAQAGMTHFQLLSL
jgi:uncharacterized protein